MTADGRKSRRKPTNKAGVAKFDGREAPVLLRDLSQVGARIRSVGAIPIPDRFRLVIPMEKVDKSCLVVWRRGGDCGVSFEA